MSRNIKLLLFAILFANFQIFKFSNCHAQVPQKFNYQGIARDTKGNPLAQQRMTLKLTVLPTADATEGEYEEVQTVTTNEFGLYTLQIGNGASTSLSTFKDIKWETGNKYIKVAIDPKGGNEFVDAGTNQLLSVPYAIYADKAGVAKNSGSNTRATNNFIEKTNSSGVTNSTSQIYDDGSKIGIGTTTPSAKFQINQNLPGVQEHIRMQDTSSTGAGRFTMYNGNSAAYATFTKYGTKYAGGYTGIGSMYPLANLLAFGNNDTNGAGNGNFLISTEGNTGISIFKGGTSKLKFHVDYATERIGMGGNAVPSAKVHFNTTTANDTIKFTNSTTGHLVGDGTEIRTSGNTTRIINRENGFTILGTNNTDRLAIDGTGKVGIGTTSPTTMLDVNGQIRIQGGNPGMNKVLTSDSNGYATWQAPISSYDDGQSTVLSNNSDVIMINSSVNTWKGGQGILVTGLCTIESGIGIGLTPQGIDVDIEVWIEYNHPNYGNIKFKSVYRNHMIPDGQITLPLNCLLPSLNGVAFKVGARNNSTYVYWDNNTNSWLVAPLPIYISTEVQGLEL